MDPILSGRIHHVWVNFDLLDESIGRDYLVASERLIRFIDYFKTKFLTVRTIEIEMKIGRIQPNGVARYAHQGKTTGTSSDSLQLRPFSKMETSLKGKNLLPEGANSFL